MEAQTTSSKASNRRPALLLLGAFAFAFCIGATVHEFGHYFVDRLVGIPEVGVVLHPFASPHIVIPGVFPDELKGWPDAAGPLNNIVLSTIVVLLVWRWRRPALLPLLLWAPMAYVQEGFSSAMGLLVAGSDSARIVSVGVPAAAVLAFSVLLFVAGLVGMWLLFPLLNLSADDSFEKKFGVLARGMGGYVGLLFLYNLVFNTSNPAELQRSMVLLVFVFLLVTLLAALHRPVHAFLSRLSRTELAPVARSAVLTALSMGGAIIVVEMLVLNS